MTDTLTSLFTRLSSDAYDLPAVIIELFLIGLCINWCAGVLQGTRGTRPLRGVLIILVVTTMVVRVLAVQFEWVRLDLLYSYVLYGLAFIALVVFQPELRRAVIRAGDVRLRRSGAPQSQLIAALVKSAGYLSRNRYGALIAIQRSVDLMGWAENGTLVRAEVSANLLNTIFFPNSPLHDLGVIIRGNRVIAANCQFPSAESDEVDIALGSRHLAAVGMSYETDALVLVISEETGVVSLADKGKLTRYLSLDDLSEELTNRLSGRVATETDVPKRRPLGSLFWLKLRRLLVVVPLTLIVWYLADQATLASDSVNVELNIRHDDPRFIVDVRGPQPETLFTTFSGPRRAIDRLDEDTANEPLEVTWVLPEAYQRPGAYSVTAQELQRIIEDARAVAERGVTVTEVGVESLLFNVDELVNLNVPIRVDSGPAQIQVEKIEPPSVDVVVRGSTLDRLPPEDQRYLLAPLGDRLTGIPPDTVQQLEVQLARRIGPIDVRSAEPRTVAVTFQVVGQTRRIKNVVVHLLVNPEVLERYEVRKTDFNEWLIEVEVQGEEAVVAGLEPSAINAFAPLTRKDVPPAGETTGDQLRTLDVIVLPPEGVSVVATPSVRVTLVPRQGAAP